MKTAIYIEDGTVQFVLTPESELERTVLDKLETAKGLTTYRGSFYETRGGWIRTKEHQTDYYDRGNDKSLIFRVTGSKDMNILP